MLKVQALEVVRTSILGLAVPAAHQVRETGTGVVLPLPWVRHLEGKGEGAEG